MVDFSEDYGRETLSQNVFMERLLEWIAVNVGAAMISMTERRISHNQKEVGDKNMGKSQAVFLGNQRCGNPMIWNRLSQSIAYCVRHYRIPGYIHKFGATSLR